MTIEQFLEISGWGPIRYKPRDQIEIKPLTIFIGANNAGKSYVAITYYALSKILIKTIEALTEKTGVKELRSSEYLYSRLVDIMNKYKENKVLIDKFVNIDNIKELEQKLSNELKSILLTLINIIEENNLVLIPVSETITRDDVERIVEEVFSDKIEQLMNFESKSFRILLRTTIDKEITVTVGLQKQSHGKVKGYIDISFTKEFRRRIKNSYKRILDRRVSKYIHTYIKAYTIWEHLDKNKRAELLKSVLLAIYQDLTTYVLDKLRAKLKNRIRGLYYFPASRSGLLLNYKSLLSILLALASKPVMHREIHITAPPGYISDFINYLILAEANITESKLSSMFEDYLLNGKIVIEKVDGATDIYYLDDKGNKIPLKRISSLVSELAPLDVYIKKGYFNRGSIVIIEEPESHLHPRAQTILACFLAKLVKEYGVRVLITTHSDILMTKLSNIVSKYYAEAPIIENEHILCKNIALPKDTISVYLFRKSGKWSTIERITVTELGIPDEEFRSIYENLYEEYMSIYYRIKKEQ